MKRCSHRMSGTCYLRTKSSDYDMRYAFQADHTDIEFRPWYKCTEEMAEVCDFRVWSPREKVVPKNPRSEWLDCPYCGGRHRNQDTANTCKFIHEDLKRLNATFDELASFLEEGSTEEWPPYQTTLTQDIVWSYMVSSIIKRDNGCCTDCGLSYFEFKAMQDVMITYKPKTWTEPGASREMYVKLGEIVDLKDFPNFEVHHIIPRVRGGTHHPHNLRLLCSVCHRKYTNELLDELATERRERLEECAAAEQSLKFKEFQRSHPALESYDQGTD